ncbi:MAG: C39 family peptidase [Candidatus Sericytochromatia bacterium]
MLKKISSIILSSLFITVLSCNKQNETDISVNNTTNIQSNKSIKNFNISQRKKFLAKNTNKPPKLSVKDLPANFMFLPLARQSTDYTCGVGSLQSIMMYYGDEYMEGELAKSLKSDPNEGTAYANIKKFSEENGYSVKIYKDMKIEDLKKLIDNKKPVLVLLQAWSEKPTDYSKDWEDGHYSIAIGYDDKRFYFMDPSSLGYYTYIPTKDFLDRWHDTDTNEKLNHFGMVIEKGTPKYNHNNLIMME